MIYCNLAVLLAERHIKISKASADTGISRTTLTALCQNTGKGVQTDTLNTLCMYLGISVGELYTFFPFDIDIVDCTYYNDDQSADLVFSYTSSVYNGEISCLMKIDISNHVYPDRSCHANLSVHEYTEENTVDADKNKLLREAFCALPHPVIEHIKSQIADAAVRAITYQTNVEVDGEIYGYPEAMDTWEIDVSIPSSWKGR